MTGGAKATGGAAWVCASTAGDVIGVTGREGAEIFRTSSLRDLTSHSSSPPGSAPAARGPTPHTPHNHHVADNPGSCRSDVRHTPCPARDETRRSRPGLDGPPPIDSRSHSGPAL